MHRAETHRDPAGRVGAERENQRPRLRLRRRIVRRRLRAAVEPQHGDVGAGVAPGDPRGKGLAAIEDHLGLVDIGQRLLGGNDGILAPQSAGAQRPPTKANPGDQPTRRRNARAQCHGKLNQGILDNLGHGGLLGAMPIRMGPPAGRRHRTNRQVAGNADSADRS